MLQQYALAGAAGADDHQAFAGIDRQRQIVQHDQPAESLAEVAEFNEGHGYPNTLRFPNSVTYQSLATWAKKKFSMMMAMNDSTKLSVHAFPTPLAPDPQVKPL